MIAQAATLMYFGYFLYMPFYSRTEITATGVRAPLVALYTIVTVGIIFYWFNADGVTVVNKAIISVVTLAFTIYFLILPAYSKPAVVKPVPERVTK
jgi:hypothetical protein